MTLTTSQQRHHYRELLVLGIPIIIGQLGTIVLGFADTLMIGHHSTEELAAAGLVNNIFGLVLIAYMGFSYGLTPVVGRLYGMGQNEAVGGKVKNSLVANGVVGLLFTAVMTFLYFNLEHIGQPDELLSLIRPYFLVNLASILFVGLFNTLKQFFDGIAQTKVAMWTMVGGNLLNILFNWLLIYGVGGFPEMGLRTGRHPGRRLDKRNRQRPGCRPDPGTYAGRLGASGVPQAAGQCDSVGREDG